MFVTCDAYQEGFLIPEVNELIVEQHERLESLNGLLFKK